MSVREGTRRKKISVLHMLGTWEGKIDGCNCPSCKEYDEEQVAAVVKSPNKVITKTVKGPKTSPKKTVIKVKTTKVIVDKGTGELIGRKLSPKKYNALRNVEDNIRSPECAKLLQDSEDNEKFSGRNVEVENKGLEGNKTINSRNVRTSEDASFNVKDLQQSYNKESLDTDKVKRVLGRENRSIHGIEEFSKNQGERRFHENQALSKGKNRDIALDSKVLIVSQSSKAEGKTKHIGEESKAESLQIKQEPDDFFSDEEEIEKGESGKHYCDGSKSDSRVRKRARMVTSEVENIYAKPRMVFTGRGVVRKYEPGTDKSPKSRRGRKPAKNVSSVKVKQEPKDSEENEESELDQLQKALSEAADSLDVGDDLLDALNDFEEEPKEVKVRKKAKFRLLKRVDSDGDKYVECTLCFKMLKESSMKQHYKTHTGEKPHICDECDARFTRKGDVERHKRLVHKNQKPFKCKKCKRNFSDRKNLKLHLQNHDKAIYYACNTCGFKFGKREYYENHIRYIHPLPDGSMPVFCDMDQDLAIEQLQEIESEEKKEKQEKEGKNRNESVLTVKNEIENLKTEEEEEEEEDDDEDEMEEDEEEVDTAAEITVTEGQEESPVRLKKEDITADHRYLEGNSQVLGDMKVQDTNSLSEASFVTGKSPQVGTDVRVSKGTLSFTQTVSDTDTQDEDLVNKAIADAVSQAANTIESLQTIAGANMSGNDVDLDDEDEDDLMEDDDEFQEILDSGYDIIPIAQEPKPVEQPSEIHINASVGGQKKKFIIQVPPGSNLNVQTPEGMEMIVSMVNQLCAGKGDLDGPIEVVMNNPNTRTLSLD